MVLIIRFSKSQRLNKFFKKFDFPPQLRKFEAKLIRSATNVQIVRNSIKAYNVLKQEF